MVKRIQERVARVLRVVSAAQEAAKNARELPNLVAATRVVESDGARFTLFFVGRALWLDTFRHYGHMLVDEHVDELTPPHLVARRKRLRGLVDAADLAFVDPLLAPALGLRPSPQHVPFLRALLPVMGSLDAQIAHVSSDGYRRRLKKLAKTPARVTVDASDAGFERFYTTMYEPLARSRFKRDALLDRASLERVFQRDGRVLFIDADRRTIGALVYESRRFPGMLSFLRIGTDVPPSEPSEHSEMMATAELAVFEHAIASGAHTIDFGLTFASPKNGIFVHKRRLGARFEPFPGYLPCRVVVRWPRALETFAAFPHFVTERGRALVLRLGYSGAAPDAQDHTLPSLVKDVCFVGLSRVDIHCAAPEPSEHTRAAVTRALAAHDTGHTTRVHFTPHLATPLTSHDPSTHAA